MTQQATNITWHEGEVTKEDREKQLGQKGVLLWFTGLSGSGKSTVAVALEKLLHDAGHHIYRLDGDNIRHGLNADLGFSAEDRTENIRRIGEVAKLFVDAGTIVMASFISPYKADRDAVRAIVNDGEFVEIFVDCPVEVCEERDPKGLYKKARSGEIPAFTGISDPYEAPDQPEVTIKTHEQTVEEATQHVVEYMKEHQLIAE